MRARDLGVDAKPHDLDLAARTDEQVLRPQITMDEARRVHGGEPFGQLGRDIQHLTDFELSGRARGEKPLESAARVVLQNDAQAGRERLDAPHGDEVGRGEARDALVLMLEACKVGARRTVRPQDLQQDRSAIARRACADEAEIGRLRDALAERVAPLGND